MFFIIPGPVIAAVTFPGVIVHEAAHLLFCRLRKVAVFDACFFRFGNPAGYVVHEPPKDFTSTLLICMGPFLLNTLLCVAICFPVMLPREVFGVHNGNLLMLWLGISIGMHAIPSTGDVSTLWHEGWAAAKRGNPLGILSLPLAGLIALVNAGRIIWLDAIYGAAVGIGLPMLLLNWLSA
ncbi:MAG: metalloprotease family protein [Planctomycetaceae bacterium]|nr:metalloprotease family protein [Planctomycetaceae bacterium]